MLASDTSLLLQEPTNNNNYLEISCNAEAHGQEEVWGVQNPDPHWEVMNPTLTLGSSWPN